ncbi:MAG: methyltransferase [Nocardioides sp.]
MWSGRRGPDGAQLLAAAPLLRAALAAAGYGYDAVAELLGPLAHAALGRNETTPGLRRTADGSPLATLVRLFLLQASVPRDHAERALPGLVDRLVSAGLLATGGGEAVACLDVRPYAATDAAGDRDLWVVSDLTPGLDGSPTHVGADHVLGVSPASVSLAQLTLRHRVGRALDLGTGCGVQALHLAGHVDRVVATDVNARALALAACTVALNDVAGVDVRDGSFLEPVAGERFDLIATNPPFVISPGTGERLVYRDSGLPGDRAVELIVRAAPDHLTDGGWCQVLANWIVPADGTWDERLATWLDGRCDALVVQREVLDPAEYVELWLTDSGHHGSPDYAARYDTWLSWLDRHGVAGVGFGWLNLRRRPGDAGDGRHELWDWPYAVEQPIAPAVAEWASALDSPGSVADLAAAILRRAEDVVQETVGPPGGEHPERIVLRRQRGFRRARTVDTVEAALVGASDGDLAVGALLAAIAALLDRDPAELTAAVPPGGPGAPRRGVPARLSLAPRQPRPTVTRDPVTRAGAVRPGPAPVPLLAAAGLERDLRRAPAGPVTSQDPSPARVSRAPGVCPHRPSRPGATRA